MRPIADKFSRVRDLIQLADRKADERAFGKAGAGRRRGRRELTVYAEGGSAKDVAARALLLERKLTLVRRFARFLEGCDKSLLNFHPLTEEEWSTWKAMAGRDASLIDNFLEYIRKRKVLRLFVKPPRRRKQPAATGAGAEFQGLSEREVRQALSDENPGNPIGREVVRIAGAHADRLRAFIRRNGFVPAEPLCWPDCAIETVALNMLARAIAPWELRQNAPGHARLPTREPETRH